MINSIFSLELLALTKIAVCVYSESDVKTWQCVFMQENNWNLVEKRFSSLKLPSILEKKLIALMKPINAQIEQWEWDHCPILRSCSWRPPTEYIWKDNGTIDRIKTAKAYVQCGNNDASMRFQMACVYWMEEEVKKLWEEMPEDLRRHLSSVFAHLMTFVWMDAVNDWIKFIKSGDADWRRHPCFRPLSWYCEDIIVIQGNLLQHLSYQDQLGVFQRMMKESIPIHTKSFCLSKMRADQFEHVIKKEPLHVYVGLYDWPYRFPLQEMTNLFLPLLSVSEFLYFLLEAVSGKMVRDWKNCDYVEQTNKLWNQSPDIFRQHVEKSEFSNILYKALNQYIEFFRSRCCTLRSIFFSTRKSPHILDSYEMKRNFFLNI
ncbi:uncharacterized protein NPIL_189321 [Nephila pilipes]|uniref:Uncharacterized protein n=1 Tax=Nephila pilipes TaxID=299642 RepID=A0A8X6T630_NEPPI|nr:uncharacterized protein NPIL_189321 [Nephila pilipes]